MAVWGEAPNPNGIAWGPSLPGAIPRQGVGG